MAVTDDAGRPGDPPLRTEGTRRMVIRDRQGTPRVEVVWRNLVWLCAMLASLCGLVAFFLKP